MLTIFKPKPLVDNATHLWMIDTYRWILAEFDSEFFQQKTVLVLPTNEFFPGKVESITDYARLVLSQLCKFAGLEHWPFVLVDETGVCPTQMPKLEFNNGLRGEASSLVPNYTAPQQLPIQFTSTQLNQPQHLIASISHQMAQHLTLQNGSLPPGEQEFWSQATEVLATAMGFGVMQANSSYEFRGGCSSCFNPNAVRQSSLTEADNVYALAIFSLLKDIDHNLVKKHLKSHLRPFYKRAIKQLEDSGDLVALKQQKLLGN